MTDSADIRSPNVAIVTGADGGIGAGVVSAFRDVGYAVVGTSKSMPSSDEPDYLTVEGDITRPETAALVVEEALGRFGRIDSLVNMAGIYIGKPFTDYTLDDYLAITAVNLTGFFHITQRVLPPDGQPGTRSCGQHHDQPRRPRRQPAAGRAHGPHQGGLAAVTRSLAIEYASRGVRVNAVSPGVIETPLHDPASYEGLAALHPLGRVGEVSDVADAILYLERATFVTGEILHVDGGQAAGH